MQRLPACSPWHEQHEPCLPEQLALAIQPWLLHKPNLLLLSTIKSTLVDTGSLPTDRFHRLNLRNLSGKLSILLPIFPKTFPRADHQSVRQPCSICNPSWGQSGMSSRVLETSWSPADPDCLGAKSCNSIRSATDMIMLPALVFQSLSALFSLLPLNS